jgi:hypothetical protein
MAGLDPAIHQSSRKSCEGDGLPGPGYAKASPGFPRVGPPKLSEGGKPGNDETNSSPGSGFLRWNQRPGYAFL